MNWKPVAVFLPACVLGFLLMGNAPLGNMLWPPADGPDPEGANLALLMAIGFVEVVAFGLGACVLAFGLPHARRLTGSAGAYAVAVWLSVAWTLVNWVPHTALHMSVGNILTPSDYSGLVAIEYGFHLTLVLAGATLMHTLFRGRGAASPKPAGMATKTGRAA